MRDHDLTPEKLLEQLGVPNGSWTEVEEHTTKIPALTRQAEILCKIRDLFEGALIQDQAALVRLHEQLARLKHGGGV